MRWFPKSFGGTRCPPEHLKRDGWRDQNVLVIDAGDARLSWPEREFIRQIGEKLYGRKDLKQ
jgi:hypothetical protein